MLYSPTIPSILFFHTVNELKKGQLDLVPKTFNQIIEILSSRLSMNCFALCLFLPLYNSIPIIAH